MKNFLIVALCLLGFGQVTEVRADTDVVYTATYLSAWTNGTVTPTIAVEFKFPAAIVHTNLQMQLERSPNLDGQMWVPTVGPGEVVGQKFSVSSSIYTITFHVDPVVLSPPQIKARLFRVIYNNTNSPPEVPQ